MLLAKIAAFYKPDSLLGGSKATKFTIILFFYITSLSGILSAIIITAILWNKLSSYILFSKIFRFFRYIALQGLPILESYCYIIIVVDIFLKTYRYNNFKMVFTIKILAITSIIYFIIVPLVYSKFYSIFGKDKAKWNSFIFNKYQIYDY